MSTAFNGDSGTVPFHDGGIGKGAEVGCVLVLGEVPNERAAITS